MRFPRRDKYKDKAKDKDKAKSDGRKAHSTQPQAAGPAWLKEESSHEQQHPQ